MALEAQRLMGQRVTDSDLKTLVPDEVFKMLGEEEFWDIFERVDSPTLKYDFATSGESPLITGMTSFVSVSTFLAGFAVSDLGSFSVGEWGDAHVRAYVYICMMAFVTGATLWCSVVGTFLLAVYYRSLNQTWVWEAKCNVAVRPIEAAMSQGDGLKGRRRKLYTELFHEIANKTADFRNMMTLGNKFFDQTIRIVVVPEGDLKTWTIKCEGPCHMVAGCTWLLFHSRAFPAAVVLFAAAKALKALTGVLPWVSACVVFILASWTIRLCLNLQAIYAKLCD